MQRLQPIMLQLMGMQGLLRPLAVASLSPRRWVTSPRDSCACTERARGRHGYVSTFGVMLKEGTTFLVPAVTIVSGAVCCAGQCELPSAAAPFWYAPRTSL